MMPPISVVEVAGRLVCAHCKNHNYRRKNPAVPIGGFVPGYRITGLTPEPLVVCRTCAALVSAAFVLAVKPNDPGQEWNVNGELDTREEIK